MQTIALLLAVDYLWNAWHFAAQHSGISRIYARSARPDIKSSGMYEKVLLRVFVLYVIFRVLGLPVIQEERAADWLGWLVWLVHAAEGLDLYMLALPVALLARDLWDFRASMRGRLAYLGSVCTLYSAILLVVHFNEGGAGLAAGLFLAITLFHATEYLAIVSWAVWKKHGNSTRGLFAYLVPRWGLVLVTFMAVLALTAWMLDRHYFRAWLLMTIIVSYLHYAYDGMIWKAPRKPTAPAATA
jgi:hypothetical protein